MPGEAKEGFWSASTTGRIAKLGEQPPTEVVVLYSNERQYDLDRCVWIAEQSLELPTEGVAGSDRDILPPQAGATVHLVDRGGECVFYFGAPQQELVAVRAGNGRYPKAEPAAEEPDEEWIRRSIRNHRSWVSLSLDSAHDRCDPARTMLLHKLTGGFMDDRTLLLHLPGPKLLVRGSDAVRNALRDKPFAEALLAE